MNAASPLLIKQQMSSVRGAKRVTGGRLLTWSDRGIGLCDALGMHQVFDLEGVCDVRPGVGGRVIAVTDTRLHVLDADWRLCERIEVSGADRDAVLQGVAAPDPLATAPFGPSAHSRFGLVARIDTDRVSLGVISGTRLL